MEIIQAKNYEVKNKFPIILFHLTNDTFLIIPQIFGKFYLSNEEINLKKSTKIISLFTSHKRTKVTRGNLVISITLPCSSFPVHIAYIFTFIAYIFACKQLVSSEKYIYILGEGGLLEK